MKAYTDINQSKRLAEILPLESVDMRYHTISHYNPYPCDEIVYTVDFGKVSVYDIPCWSLAALANLLPAHLFEFDRGIDLSIYPNLNGKGWHVAYMPNNKVDFEKDSFRLISNGTTLVDALYDMIIKLHEKNLLKNETGRTSDR